MSSRAITQQLRAQWLLLPPLEREGAQPVCIRAESAHFAEQRAQPHAPIVAINCTALSRCHSSVCVFAFEVERPTVIVDFGARPKKIICVRLEKQAHAVQERDQTGDIACALLRRQWRCRLRECTVGSCEGRVSRSSNVRRSGVRLLASCVPVLT